MGGPERRYAMAGRRRRIRCIAGGVEARRAHAVSEIVSVRTKGQIVGSIFSIDPIDNSTSSWARFVIRYTFDTRRISVGLSINRLVAFAA